MKCKKIILTNFLMGTLIFSFALNTTNTNIINNSQQGTINIEDNSTAIISDNCKNEYSSLNLKWYQHSSETRALYR